MAGFREIRRKERALSEQEARAILARAEHGVLATVGSNGWPYAVPVNHVLSGDTLYLHCALEGHKLENIGHEDRVSFCAVAEASVVPEKLTTAYESAIAFGRAAMVTDAVEKRLAMELLVKRVCGEMPPRAEEALTRAGAKIAVVRIRLERITGKAHRLES